MGPRHQASCAVAVAAIKIQVTLLLDSLVLIQENMYDHALRFHQELILASAARLNNVAFL